MFSWKELSLTFNFGKPTQKFESISERLSTNGYIRISSDSNSALMEYDDSRFFSLKGVKPITRFKIYLENDDLKAKFYILHFSLIIPITGYIGSIMFLILPAEDSATWILQTKFAALSFGLGTIMFFVPSILMLATYSSAILRSK